MRALISWLGIRIHRLVIVPLLSAAATLALSAGVGAAPPTLVAQPGVTAPASIAELARALKYDVNLIYEYVYTNIEYSPTFGLKKGALGTLIDGVGNDFDQSALLVALLRQSGYTASYQYGQMRLFPADIAALYGVDVSDGCPIQNLLVNGGIPVSITYTGPSVCTSPIQYADITHVWVSVTGGSLGATTAVLDPSYKTYASASGINLATATGYNQSTFLTAAKSGASFTPGFSIQNVNSGNIASQLTGYANNLVANIRATNPTATPRDVLGGKYIQPLAQPFALPSTQPRQTPGTTPTTWSGDVDNAYRTTMQIQMGGINKTYYGDAIYGHRLSIVYNSSLQPVLYLDGAAQATGTASANTITNSVTFPFCFGSGTPVAPCSGSTGSTNVFSFQNVVQAVSGYTYAIIAGWDFTGRGMADFHRRQLEINKAAGNADGSEPVLGETLNMIGYSWQAQLAGAAAVTDRIVGSKTVFHCLIGIVGQVTGPYVDMPGGFVGVSSLDNDINKVNTAFFSLGGALSALESGVLDQNLEKTSVSAVSTIKLLDLANSQNFITYDARTANWGTIRPLIAPYYFASDLAQIGALITAGYRLILPGRGNLTQGSWTGAGYIGIGTGVLTYKISSFIKGGYTTGAVPSSSLVPNVVVTTPSITPPTQVSSLDPIDLSSGAFLYDHNDLLLGSAGFPVGLGFRRSYSSNNVQTKGPLGPGWTHGFAIRAASNSDGLKGMAQDSPIDGAAAIAATYVVQDLFSDPAKPFDKVMIASLVQKWLMDRLIGNTVNVTTGSQTEQFVRLLDGSYNPQLGSSNRLSLDSGTYTLQTKDGTALAFNPAGNISTWRSPANGVVSFAYDGSTPPLLASVSNGFGRSLTFGYNGAKQLTSVSDNSTPVRSVGYSYDGNGNLATFIDPLTNVTTFAYAAPGLLSQVFYPSNPGSPFVTNTYDSLGRVSTQTSANGATWSYYFAGYRSEEDDPYGTQHVLYFNPRGKAQFDIQDAAGLNLVSTFLYDGLDRFSSTTLPEGGSTAYTYATTVNPWANNLASIVRNPKPGSPLAALTTSYTYDSIFNKPTSVTDPRGLVTTATYDSSSGNLLSVVSDSANLKATTRYTYDATGLPVTATDPLGIVTEFAYDASGNRTSIVADPGPGRLNQTTTIAYDSRGDPVSVTDPRGNATVITYDDARRPVTTTSPATSATPSGLVTTTTYDPDNRPTQVQQSAGGSVLRTVSATYTVAGKTATTTDANGNATRYDYDLLDRLATTTDAMARVTQFTYTTLGQPYRTFNPGISTVNPLLTQIWTADGQLASLADANGNATTFAYDGFDRLATATYPGGTTETYTYDADSNVLTRKTRAGGTIAFAWDTLNRLTSKTPPSRPVVSYTYDLAGRLTSASDNSAAIPSAVSPTGSPVAYATNHAYDAMNRPTGVSWNPAPTATAPGAASSVVFAHSYNKVNQRTGQSVSDNAWIDYPAAAASTVSYTANTLNQYTAVGAGTPTYDANGNLTSDGTHTYGYDAENRLVSASGAGTSGTYTFDAQGRRKTVTTGGGTTVFVTDPDDREVLEYDGASGAIRRWYAYGLGPNDVLGQMNVPANTRTTFVPDLLGSVVATMDAGTGTLSRFGYRPYGTSAAPATPFGFTGQRLDAEAGGIYYFRARAYSPGLGRFLQTDPIGYDGGLNLYAYVGNDPLNLIDPYGLKVLDGVQAALFVASFCPSVCGSAFSLIDAGVSGFRGDYVGASISTAAAIAGIVSDAGLVKGAALGGIAAADALKVSKVARELTLSRKLHGEAAFHAEDAIRAGKPQVLTIDRAGTAANRRASTSAIEKVPGKHLDEYPPAMFKEGGASASVRPINPRDNMSAGACIGNACRGLPDGARIRINIGD